MSEETKPKKVGTQEQIRKIMTDGGEHTVAELMEMTGGTKGSVSTALSHLQNEKYAGTAGVLALEKDAESGKYSMMA
jgi:DNA-binding IclR family transcriptional regulator